MKKDSPFKNKAVKAVALNALIVAVIAIMSFVPFVGYIGVGNISITTIHVAVLIFAWMFGWKEGLVAGLSFGIFSLIRAAAMPNGPIDPLFVNPAVSVFPRAAFGFLAGLTFDFLRLVKKPKLRYTIDLIVCGVLTVLHSVLTLTMLYVCYGNHEALVSSGLTLPKLLLTILSLNGALELIAGMILVPIIILPLDRAFPQYQAVYHGTVRKKATQTLYDTITAQYHDVLLQNLADFVAINSIYDEETVSKESPFGQGVTNALTFIANLAQDDGFEVKNYSNKVVEITCGEGKNITILAHADVVPAGTGWNQEPFQMVDRGDRLTGRGVADDKGPLLAAYYAMKAVRDNHLLGDYQIRFIVGGNEESGSAGVEYYFQKLKKPQPDFGFSPDAEYPLIFAEKGIINFEVKKKLNLKHIHSIHGGVASNSVIEKCDVVIDYDPDFITYLTDHSYKTTYERDGDLATVTFHGVAAHGSTPELGSNAGMAAIKALANFYTIKDLLHLHSCYGNTQGYGLEAFAESEEMGHNSMNVGIIDWDENSEFKMIVNFRYVDRCHVDEAKANIKEHSKPFSVSFLSESKLLFYPKESVLIQTLLGAYQKETGDYKSAPRAIGGGTYAKEADNVVAFGAEFPGWNSYMHSPGEQMKKADLFKSISIYAKAIVDLGKKLEERNENKI